MEQYKQYLAAHVLNEAQIVGHVRYYAAFDVTANVYSRSTTGISVAR